MAVLPDVPTVAENWITGYEATAWQRLMAPAGVPSPVVARLNQEVLKVLALPEVRSQLSRQGTDPLGSTPETYNRFVQAEIERWTKVARAGRISLE